MPSFSYLAWDREGSQRTGVVDARDVDEAREAIRTKDLFIAEIRPRATAREGAPRFWARKVKLMDMVVMSRQLATLVRAGLNMIECLQSVSTQTESAALRWALDSVRLDVMTGSTVSEAMRRHPTVFSGQYVALVNAGETGGTLDQTLDIAAEQLDKEAELREKVKAAFVYPALVMMSSICVVTFMLVFIVPVFATVYKQFHAELPAVTQMLVALSSAIVNGWWIALLVLIPAVVVLHRFQRTPRGRRLFDNLLLHLPLLGKLNRKIAIARFTQTFAGTMRAGVPILRGLAIAADTGGNVILTEAVLRVAALVKEGSMLWMPLEQTGQFPPIVTRMIAAGEQSGNLDEMLSEVTRFYARDIEYTVGKLTRLLEPAMTVVVGAIVLFVLLALYMPVFNLAQVIRK